MEKKKQHIIPQCYLKSWCDPGTPEGHEPYVWIISKDGTAKTKQAPKKTFTQRDMYTIRLPGGTRELVIEDTLSQIENSFVTIVESRIKEHVPLSDDERAELCVFAAAMFVRTRSQQTNFTGLFGRIQDMLKSLEEQHGSAPKASLEAEVVKGYAHQFAMGRLLEILPPMLYQMFPAILVTDDELGFITSDQPCVWFNPDMYKWPPFYRRPALTQQKVEVRLPLTPHHLLFLSWSDLEGYFRIPAATVDEINRATRAYCHESFISRKADIKRIWFDLGQMPEDAWEKKHARTP